MSLYEAYKKSNSVFEDIVIIGGTDYVLEFPIYDSNGNKQIITSYSATWFLSPYGQPSINIAEIECLAKPGDNYTFTVTITKNITSSLSGAFTHQIEIVLDH